jgi:hypothetical protein
MKTLKRDLTILELLPLFHGAGRLRQLEDMDS